jgi:hypothetical protein
MTADKKVYGFCITSGFAFWGRKRKGMGGWQRNTHSFAILSASSTPASHPQSDRDVVNVPQTRLLTYQ